MISNNTSETRSREQWPQAWLLTNTCLRQSPLGNDQTREIMLNTLMSSYSEQQCTHSEPIEAACQKEHFEQLQGDKALEWGG